MFWKLFDACCEYSIAAPPNALSKIPAGENCQQSAGPLQHCHHRFSESPPSRGMDHAKWYFEQNTLPGWKNDPGYSRLHIQVQLEWTFWQSPWVRPMKLTPHWHPKHSRTIQNGSHTMHVDFHLFVWPGASHSQLCIWHVPALCQPVARNLPQKRFFSRWGQDNWVVSQTKFQTTKGVFLIPLTSEWCRPLLKSNDWISSPAFPKFSVFNLM